MLHQLSRIALFLSVLFLVISSMWVLLSPTKDDSNSNQLLSCDGPNEDFGTLFTGAKVQHVFYIRNVSSSPVIISDFKAQCGCTSLQKNIVGTKIAPNGILAVPLELAVSSSEGPFDKAVRISVESNSVPLELTLSGTSIRPVKWSPWKVNFGTLSSESSNEKTVVVESADDLTEFSITDARISSGSIDVEVDLTENATRHEIILRTIPPLKIGRSDFRLLVNTSLPNQSFTIPVSMIVQDTTGASVESATILEADKQLD